MAKKLFDFDAEFKLGLESMDRQHIKLVDMLNDVHALLSEGKRDEARHRFNETLASYITEHFVSEEEFMESIGFPLLDEHRRIHESFKSFFQELQPSIEAGDELAFRKALNDTFTWIIAHIGKTDRKYAVFYFSRGSG